MTPVFYYHRVGPFRPGAPRKGNVEPARFRAQLEFLGRRGVEFLTLDEVLAGKRGAAVTFDDGFRDCLEHALPVLRDLRVPATFFIVAGGVGGTDAWNRRTPLPEERVMDWDDLKRLLDAGLSVGSHSMTHTELTAAEVAGSKRLLEERLGVKVPHFAYPRGEFPAEAPGWVRDAGYAAGWATKGGGADPFARRRLPVSANTGPWGLGWKVLKARLGWY